MGVMRDRFDEHSVISRIAEQVVTNWIILHPVVCSYFEDKNIFSIPESLFYAKSYPGMEQTIYATECLVEERELFDDLRYAKGKGREDSCYP